MSQRLTPLWTITFPMCIRNIKTQQGRRNDFGIGGAKKIFARRSRAKFFLITLSFKRIQFCSVVYLWFPISTELLTYFSHISIHWSKCRCFYNLEFFGLAKYWGGNCPPAPPVPTAMHSRIFRWLWRNIVHQTSRACKERRFQPTWILHQIC